MNGKKAKLARKAAIVTKGEPRTYGQIDGKGPIMASGPRAAYQGIKRLYKTLTRPERGQK